MNNQAVHPIEDGEEPNRQEIDRRAEFNGADNTQKGEGISWGLLAKIIFTRTLSALFIIINIVLDWYEFSQWLQNGSDEPVEPVEPGEPGEPGEPHYSWNFVEFAKAIEEHTQTGITKSVDCSNGTTPALVGIAVITALGSTMAVIQLVDIVGETLLEVRGKGFQILHGWIESVLTVVLEEIPQALVVLLINNSCRYSSDVTALSLGVMVLGMIKTKTRVSTCKQIPEPCCPIKCCDVSECCMHSIPVFVGEFICQPCAPYDKQCLRYESWDICGFLPCNDRGRSCFEGYETDPKWAKPLFGRLLRYQQFLLGVNLIFFIIRLFGFEVNII